MKNYINTSRKTTAEFTVAINDVNKSRTLLPIVLYDKMNKFAMNSIYSFQGLITSEPTLYKLNILKNAFLNDRLKIKSRIKKLSENELQLSIEVSKKLDDGDDIICNALYRVTLKENKLGRAS